MAKLPFKWPSLPELNFDVLKSSDTEEATEFIINEFFPQFPMTASLLLDVEKEIRPWLKGYVQHVIDKQLSLVVRDDSDQCRIVALVLNNLFKKKPLEENLTQSSFVDAIKRPIWTKICRLCEDIHGNIGLEQDPFICMEFVTVKKELGQHGLASKCAEVTLDMAKKNGIQLVTAEVVNEYLAKGLKKEQFQVAHEINLNFYVQNGEKPFASDTIHNKMYLFVKCVD